MRPNGTISSSTGSRSAAPVVWRRRRHVRRRSAWRARRRAVARAARARHLHLGDARVDRRRHVGAEWSAVLRVDHPGGARAGRLLRRPGRAPRPPPALERTLWPDAAEAAAPHVTELGWTLVPPNSPPQEVHADISGAYAGDGMERAMGRFHHIAWKPAAGRHADDRGGGRRIHRGRGCRRGLCGAVSACGRMRRAVPHNRLGVSAPRRRVQWRRRVVDVHRAALVDERLARAPQRRPLLCRAA